MRRKARPVAALARSFSPQVNQLQVDYRQRLHDWPFIEDGQTKTVDTVRTLTVMGSICRWVIIEEKLRAETPKTVHETSFREGDTWRMVTSKCT
jgi:hypothetical protein